jgi:hypothetical protein
MKHDAFVAKGTELLMKISVSDWSRWFVISSPLPICGPSFRFMGGVAKEYITKLGCENIFSESHTQHHWRCSYIQRMLNRKKWV